MPRRRTTRTLLTVVAAALVVASSVGWGEQRGAEVGTSMGWGEQGGAEGDPGRVPGGPERQVLFLAARARAEGRVEEAAMLSDGEVTFDERRLATERTMACMGAAGLVVAAYHEYEGPYGPDLEYIVGFGPHDPQSASDIQDSCGLRFDRYVTVAWGEQIDYRLTPRAHEALVACLAEHGFVEPIGWTLDEIDEVFGDRELVASCLAEAFPDGGSEFGWSS